LGNNAPSFTAAQQQMLDQAEAAEPAVGARLLLRLAADFWKTGQTAEFLECFERSYRLDPYSKINQLLPTGAGPEQLRQITEALLDRGCAYSAVIGAHARAEAALGRREAVGKLVDYARFYHQGVCDPPAGSTLDVFNQTLAAEIKADLTFYAEEGRSIRNTWRNDRILRSPAPALTALRSILAREMERYIDALPRDGDHPFIASRPAEYELDGWAVVSTAEGHHQSHIHPRAWATGVYYVSQPEVSRDPVDPRGWLRVGPPPDLDGMDTGWETRLVEPKAGSFILMPAYFYHSTEPMRVDQERICVAFEVQPPSLKPRRRTRSRAD